MNKAPGKFLLHGGCPDTSDQIDRFLKYLLDMQRVSNKAVSLTLFPAAKRNDQRLRKRIVDKIAKISEGRCVVDELLLGNVPDGLPTPEEEIERLCVGPQIFLIMNGDTRHASRVAYAAGVPELLENGYKGGMTLAGWSCGAIIHGNASISDSEAFAVNEAAGESWDWLTVSRENRTTFGSLNAIVCAHERQVRPTALPTSSRSEMHRKLVADYSAECPAVFLPENMVLQISGGVAEAVDFTVNGDGIIDVYQRIADEVVLRKQLHHGEKYKDGIEISKDWGKN